MARGKKGAVTVATGNENKAKYAVILKVLKKNRDANYANIKADPDWTWKDTDPAGPSVGKAKVALGYAVAGEKAAKKASKESNGVLTPAKIKAAIEIVQTKFAGDYEGATALADAIETCGSVKDFKEALAEAREIAKLFKG